MTLALSANIPALLHQFKLFKLDKDFSENVVNHVGSIPHTITSAILLYFSILLVLRQ